MKFENGRETNSKKSAKQTDWENSPVDCSFMRGESVHQLHYYMKFENGRETNSKKSAKQADWENSPVDCFVVERKVRRFHFKWIQI